MPKVSFTSALAACIFLGGMGALTIFDIFDGPGTARQERVAQTPQIPSHLAQIPGFLGKSRYYATERYALKESFITLNGIVKMGIFGHSPASNVTLGSDGFLFLNILETVDGSQGRGRINLAEQSRWASHFDAVHQAFKDQELPFALVIGPNKHSIYPEMTPDWLVTPPMDATRTADVMAVAQSVFGDAFFDTRAALEQARGDQPDVALYHATDTHWTEWGAALALHEVLTQQGLDLPTPEFEITTLVRSGDLSRMVGQQGRWAATAPTLPRGWSCVDPSDTPLEVITIDPLMPHQFTCGTSHARPEKLAVFMDSFGVSAIPYLAARFQTVNFIWTNAADPQMAASLKADYVLQILVERKLMTDIPEQFLAQPAASQ